GSRYTATSGGGSFIVPGADHIGEVQAWNVDTGKRVWTHTYATSQNWGPLLATGGGVVFSGGTNYRKFHPLDAATGKLLWEFAKAVSDSASACVSRRRAWPVNLTRRRRFRRPVIFSSERAPPSRSR